VCQLFGCGVEFAVGVIWEAVLDEGLAVGMLFGV
jgi:hypothetical protein